MRKVGIFLGSFNPPHIGHLSVVSEALRYGISKVIVVPSYHNPWKITQVSYDLRVQMTIEAFRSYGDLVEVSQVERSIIEEGLSDDPTTVPSVLTLNYLRESYEDEETELYIVTTSETYKDIIFWKDGKDILDNFPFLIICPDHFSFTRTNLIKQDDLIDYSLRGISICSTQLRTSLYKKIPCFEYLPGSVYSIIKSNKLYE